MNKSAWILLLGLALAVSNAWWIYSAIDSGVTITHQFDSLSRRANQLESLRLLIQAISPAVNQSELNAIATKHDVRIKKDSEDKIWFGEVLLTVNDGRIVDLSSE